MGSFKLVDLARLQGQLNIAQVRQNDEPLYQVVSQLITAVKQVQDTVNFNISTFSNGIDVSAGTSHRTVTQLIFSNQNSLTFGLSNNSITASANPGILFSASGSSGRFTGLTFSNSNNITFGNSNGVVTASILAQGLINVSASNTSVNLTNLVFSNSNGVSFGLSGSTLTGSISINTSQQSINFSAGAHSNNLSNVIFSNSNGIAFGLSGSTITASYTSPTLTNSSWTVSDSATSGTVAQLAFINSNQISFSLSTGTGGLHTLLGSVATSLTNICVSAGTSSATLSKIVFSDSNGVSFGLNGSTITATAAGGAAGATFSYWENIPVINTNNGAISVLSNQSSYHLQPFLLPVNLTASFLRGLWFNKATQIGVSGTTANTTWTVGQSFTTAYVLYTRGNGASSNSLSSVFSSSTSSGLEIICRAGATGSQFTMTYRCSYPATGNSSSFSTSYGNTRTDIFINSAVITQVLGNKFCDLPFVTSLSPGQYFMGFGLSTSSTANGVGSNIANNCKLTYSSFGIAQDAVSYAVMGESNSTAQMEPGLGSFTTNSAFLTTAALDLSQISSRTFNVELLLQFYKVN